MSNGKSFRYCQKCNKKLIERMPSGMWRFQFGRKFNDNGEPIDEYVPVDIFIHGSLKIKCLKKSCGHWNVFHYFPNFKHLQSASVPKDNQQKADIFNHAEK